MNDKKAHYYGDIVRKLFLAAAIFMIILLPFMNQYLEAPIYISIITAVGIGVFAGITNPKQTWVAFLNFLIALSGSIIFEYQAVIGYSDYSIYHRTFWGNQILALDFLIALYFCTKTVRGMIVR